MLVFGWIGYQHKVHTAACYSQLSQRLSAAEAAANSGLHQAAMHAQEQLEQLSAGHTARVDALRAELAADAARRAEAEAKAQVCLVLCGRWLCYHQQRLSRLEMQPVPL